MKILHTGDLHLGHVLYKHERAEEQSAMLRQMVEIAAEEQPDLFLIAGDVFHTAQPAAWAQKLFNDTILDLHLACPSMTIVATAGNHDSGVRHESFKQPWHFFSAHMIGTYDADDDPDRYIIPIGDKGWLIALPYIHEFYLKPDTFQRLIDIVRARNSESKPIIVTAHTAVQGADFTGHDNASEKNIGGITALPVQCLGEGYDYMALGHIHKPQFIHTGRHNVRYSGSPLEVSFDEAYTGLPHSVTILTIAQHGEQLTEDHFRFIPIRNIRPLVSIPASGALSLNEAIAALQQFDSAIPAFVRLNVNQPVPNGTLMHLRDEQWLQAKQCVLCTINELRASSAVSDNEHLSVQAFRQIAPIDIAKRYADDEGLVFNDELQSLFNEVLEAIEQEDRNA